MVGDFAVCNIVMMCVLFYGEILWIGDFPGNPMDWGFSGL